MAVRTLQIMVGGLIPVDIGPVAEVELLELLGMGGYGSVWRVRDTGSGTLYVLKIIQGIDPKSVTVNRVRLEASVSIPSEHIIPAVGLTEWDPSTFLILFEFFPGISLDKLIEAGALSSEQKKQIFKQVLVGVSDAHKSNVIHRDLKPANILVGEDGTVKLIDFGISKFKGAGLTLTGVIMGTPPYMAPELIRNGAKVADARADIYALGQILYELAMDQHFWHRMGWWEFRDLYAFLTRTPAPTEVIDMEGFHCDFFPEASSLIPMMVKIDPDQRYSSVDEVLSHLGYVVGLPPTPPGLHLRSPLLIVESGSNKGARTVLGLPDGEKRELGRYDLAGADKSIGRRHLEIHRKGGNYYVRDLGSKNGTMVRGIELEADGPPVELRHTDRIRVGDIFLRFAFLK